MSGQGIFGTVSRVVGYLIAIGIAASIITLVVISFLQPRWQEASTLSFNSIADSMRSMIGYSRATGVAVGRAVVGVDPPTIADRLAAASSQHIVTLDQEVVMTGGTGGGCLGAENEVMIEVQNDIGADQLDISYAFEGLEASSVASDTTTASRPVKVASCGPRSVIRQCIPVPPSGRAVRLHTLAYYYEAATETPVTDVDGMVSLPPKRTASQVREESRIYPSLLDAEELKVKLMASSFVPVQATATAA